MLVYRIILHATVWHVYVAIVAQNLGERSLPAGRSPLLHTQRGAKQHAGGYGRYQLADIESGITGEAEKMTI